MPDKENLLKKLFAKPMPSNFTIRDLDKLMKKCGCTKFPGGRGSSIRYVHQRTGRVLQFDGPHPGNELYHYQVKMVRKFLIDIKEASR